MKTNCSDNECGGTIDYSHTAKVLRTGDAPHNNQSAYKCLSCGRLHSYQGEPFYSWRDQIPYILNGSLKLRHAQTMPADQTAHA